jgi:hypothetical protein
MPNKLIDKLVSIQGRLKAPKNQRNNFGKYNYRSCEDILEAVKPLLKEEGLVLTLTDQFFADVNTPYIEATAALTDGSEHQVTVTAQAGVDTNRKGMDISQSFGSSSSYARKYALNGLFLIDDTKDADATNKHGKKLSIEKPILKPNTPEFNKVKNYLDKGGDIKAVNDKYFISDMAKIKLINQ